MVAKEFTSLFLNLAKQLFLNVPRGGVSGLGNITKTRTNWPRKVRELILNSDSGSGYQVQGGKEWAYRITGSQGGKHTWSKGDKG